MNKRRNYLEEDHFKQSTFFYCKLLLLNIHSFRLHSKQLPKFPTPKPVVTIGTKVHSVSYICDMVK